VILVEASSNGNLRPGAGAIFECIRGGRHLDRCKEPLGCEQALSSEEALLKVDGIGAVAGQTLWQLPCKSPTLPTRHARIGLLGELRNVCYRAAVP